MQLISMLSKGSTREGMSGGIVLGGMSGKVFSGNVQGEMSGGKCASLPGQQSTINVSQNANRRWADRDECYT